MEEKVSAVIHGIGAVFAVVGLIMLVVNAMLQGGMWHVLSVSIYGTSLVLLYLASTLYHSFGTGKIKDVFKVLDHSAIYLLIAGTYTPFMLVPLHGTFGWTIFGVIWGMAVIGVILKIFWVKRFKLLSTICYLIMGWLIVICLKPLHNALPAFGVFWLIAGGLFYTLGVPFYIHRWFPYNHAVWHLFVLAGSISHYIAIFWYVLPLPVLT